MAVDAVVAAMETAGTRLLSVIDGQALGPVRLSREEGLDLQAAFVADGARFHTAREALTPVLTAEGDTSWIEHLDALLDVAKVGTQLGQTVLSMMATGETLLVPEELRVLRPKVETHLAQCREMRRTIAAVLEAKRG